MKIREYLLEKTEKIQHADGYKIWQAETGNTIHQCDKCGEKFSSKDARKSREQIEKHMKIH